VTAFRHHLRPARFVGIHLLLSGAVAAAFVREFGHRWFAVATHVLVLAEWDALVLLTLGLIVAFTRQHRIRWARAACALLFAATFTFQVYLYALDAVSNAFWGRNITGQLVVSFLPTVWSGKEPIPVGAAGIALFTFGVIATMTLASRWWGPMLDDSLRAWRLPRLRLVAAIATAATVFAATISWGVHSDRPLWNTELVAGFFRPFPFAFEPTQRRRAAGDRDDVLRAAYPRHVATARRKNVLLVIVDSLRADHMQVYGYQRPTTPFLSRLVQSGRMKKVADAFSTCSESFCGITSTLSGREFRDISARDFQIQDVLRDEGYQTWFLLSGNHRAWNGLTEFYGASDGTYFDGSQTRRYSMDDDRGVLEAMEHVPEASPDRPAFFYVHLMSTHYLGVQFPQSHVYTRPDDQVNPGPDAYSMLPALDKPDRYDDKVTQADDVIRQVFEALGAKHYLDDAVVVVTADHGEGLGERHWAHGWHLYNEDIRIPLLLYDAPAASYSNLTFATQVDIAPTILDRLGLPIPASWAGRSLVSPAIKQYSVHQTYFLPNRFAVLYRDGDALFKFIATPQYGQEELYDLRHDSGEGRNLAADQPALAGLLRERVRTYLTDEP
jgi:arylsulfatase A-like enzyme